MADNSTPAIPVNSATLNELSEVSEYIGAKLQDTTAITENASKAFNMFSAAGNLAGKALGGLSDILKTNDALFGTSTAFVLGAKEAYTNLGGIKSDGLMTFTKSYETLANTIKDSPAFGLARQEAANLMAQQNMSAKAIEEFMGAPAKAAEATFKNMLMLADNGARMQNTLIQIASAGGNMNDMLKDAGVNFENMGPVTSKFAQDINNTAKTMNIMPEQAAEYGAELMKMAGGLKAVDSDMQHASQGTNILSAALLFARGAGIDEGKFIKSITDTTREYGMSAEEGAEQALLFSASQTKIASSIAGMPLDAVSAAIKTATDTYSGFIFGTTTADDRTKQATQSLKGAAAAVDDYATRLEASGVPQAKAAEMAGKLTASFDKLDVGQKALLSAQSGGPGGLLGAFQIDKMIQDGDLTKLDEMREKAMKKITGGHILELKDVHTQADAGQLNREIRMMTKGPLAMAGSDKEAMAMLSEMAKGKTAEQIRTEKAARGEGDRGLDFETATERGRARVDQTRNPMSEMAVNVKQMQVTAEQIILTSAQRTVTAEISGHGDSVKGEGRSVDMAQHLKTDAHVEEKQQHGDKYHLINQFAERMRNAPSNVLEAAMSAREQVFGVKQPQLTSEQLRARTTAARTGQTVATSAHGITPTTTYPAAERAGEVNGQNHGPTWRYLQSTIAAPKKSEATTAATTSAQATNPLGSSNSVPISVSLSGPIQVKFTGKCIYCGNETSSNATGQAAFVTT